MDHLTHLDERGQARMVDVTDKAMTQRIATAQGRVFMKPETFRAIQEGGVRKGNVLEVARLAGILGAKRTSELIPLCHPLSLSYVEVTFLAEEASHSFRIQATVKVHGPTGVEMEALTAVSISALTIYDMCKSIDRDMEISDIRLIRKEGGKSGIYERTLAPEGRQKE